LLIPDIIEPLRQISEVAARVESNDPLPHYALEAFNYADRICAVCNDILTLNPKGLVSGDKTILNKLQENIATVKQKTNFSDYVDVTNKAAPAAQPNNAYVNAYTNTPEPHINIHNFQTTPETLRIIEQYQFPGSEVAASPSQDNNLSYHYDINSASGSLYNPANGSQQQFEGERYVLPEQDEYTSPYQQHNVVQIFPAKPVEEFTGAA
jgi:hypothetical protein